MAVVWQQHINHDFDFGKLSLLLMCNILRKFIWMCHCVKTLKYFYLLCPHTDTVTTVRLNLAVIQLLLLLLRSFFVIHNYFLSFVNVSFFFHLFSILILLIMSGVLNFHIDKVIFMIINCVIQRICFMFCFGFLYCFLKIQFKFVNNLVIFF